MDAVEQGAVLTAFSRALGREAHVLTQRPDLLWQQLHNDLRPLNISSLASLLEKEANQRRGKLWLKQRGGAGAASMRVIASLRFGIEACDWSPATGLLGIGCRDGTVQLIYPMLVDPIVLGRHEGPVSCCRFSPNGSFLISGSKDSTLYVFQVAARKQCSVFRSHQSPVTCLALLPNGKHAVSGSQDRSLIVWNIETLEIVKTLRGHDRGVLCCTISADGSRLASGDTGGRLVLWNLHTFEPLRSFTAHDDAVLCCALNRSGDILITGAADESARIWHLNEAQPPVELAGHTDEVAGCGFAGDDQVVTISADQSIRTWDAVTGALAAVSYGRGGAITCLSMQPDGSIAYTGATNGSVLAWTVAELGKEAGPTGHSAAVTSVVVSPRGEIATTSLDGSAILWRITDGSVLHQLLAEERLTGCALRQGGATLITVGSHKPLIEWDVSSGKQLRSIPLGMNVSLGCASDPFHGPLVQRTMSGLTVREPDGSTWKFDLQMESGAQRDRVKLAEIERSVNLPGGITRGEIKEIMREHDAMMLPGIDSASAQCLAVQAGGQLAAVGDATGRVTLVDLKTRAVVRILPAPTVEPAVSTRSVALAPDCQHIAVGYSSGRVAVLSLEGEICVQWKERGGVLACAFNGNSQLLAIGTDDKNLSVSKWRERSEVYHLPMTHAVQACAFSQDAPVLACADAGGEFGIVEMIGLDNLFDPT
jgi:WD40 repeat protein